MAIDVTGINTAKIGAMQQAIEDWAKAVDSAKITLASKNVTKAIKGSVQQAQVKKLCQACDSYTNTLTTKLRNYKNRLKVIGERYAYNDNDATAFSSATSAIKNLSSKTTTTKS